MADITEWSFSSHAVDRALDMALDPEELNLALTRPHLIRPAPVTRPEYEGQQIHVRDRIALVVNPVEKSVITVMWLGQFKAGDTGRRRSVSEDEHLFRD